MKKSTAWLTCEACGKTKRQTTNLKKRKKKKILTHTERRKKKRSLRTQSEGQRRQLRGRIVPSKFA